MDLLGGWQDTASPGRRYRGGPSSLPQVGTQGALAPRQEIVQEGKERWGGPGQGKISMNQCTDVSEEGEKRLIWSRIWGASHWS